MVDRAKRTLASRRDRWRLVTVALLLGAFALGAAACGGSDTEELEQRVAALELEVDALQQRVETLETETEEIRSIVRTIEGLDLAGLTDLGGLLERVQAVLPVMEQLAESAAPLQDLLGQLDLLDLPDLGSLSDLLDGLGSLIPSE